MFQKLYQHLKADFKLRVFLTLLFGALFFTASLRFIRGQISQGEATFLLSASATDLIPEDIFTVNVGINTPHDPVHAVDVMLSYNNTILLPLAVEPGTSSLKSVAPGTNNTIDMTQAVTIDPNNPSRSVLNFGMMTLDQELLELTNPIQGRFDPETNPLAIIQFQTLTSGQSTIDVVFENIDVTTDANIVTLTEISADDILIPPTENLTITVSVPTPTPTPTPSVTPTPSATPSPTATPTPSPVATPTPTPSPTSSPTPSPSPTPTATPVPTPTPTPCESYDFNGDGSIDITDIMLVASRWDARQGDQNYVQLYDINKDGIIDIFDINVVANHWEYPCGT